MAEGRVVDRALMDYVLIPKRMRGRLLDVKVCRGEGGRARYCLVWWLAGCRALRGGGRGKGWRCYCAGGCRGV